MTSMNASVQILHLDQQQGSNITPFRVNRLYLMRTYRMDGFPSLPMGRTKW